MPQANVIHWREGQGWLVLSGGGDIHSADTGEIEAEALARVRAGDPVAYIWAAGDVETADTHLAALDDLGAPTGYLVDILTEDDETLREQLSLAGLIVLGDGPNVGTLRSAIPGGALEGITKAFEDGAVILGVGKSAAILGSFLSGQDGLGWVEDAIIVPEYEAESEIARMHDLLAKHPTSYGLGIATGSALALGPEGNIEAWGKGQVTVTLGHNFA